MSPIKEEKKPNHFPRFALSLFISLFLCKPIYRRRGWSFRFGFFFNYVSLVLKWLISAITIAKHTRTWTSFNNNSDSSRSFSELIQVKDIPSLTFHLGLPSFEFFNCYFWTWLILIWKPAKTAVEGSLTHLCKTLILVNLFISY